jgi:hypothetical protein
MIIFFKKMFINFKKRNKSFEKERIDQEEG